MDVQVGDPTPEYEQVDEVGAGLLAQHSRYSSQHGSQAGGFGTFQVRDVRDMPLRLEVGKAWDLSLDACRQPPQIVFPDQDPTQLRIPLRSPTNATPGTP